jgi:hypothetical protein
MMIINGNWARIWKDAEVAYFKVVTWHLNQQTEENRKKKH